MSDNREKNKTFALPNNMKIPESKIAMFARGEMKGVRDPELRYALIRDYVRANPEKIITLDDFAMAGWNSKYGGAAAATITKLRKDGRLTRRPIPGNKRKYTYEWHDKRQVDPNRTNGPVVTRFLETSPSGDTGLSVERVESGARERFKIVNIDNKIYQFLMQSELSDITAIREFRNWYVESIK